MPARCTEQCDTERDPRALEHEKADIVDGFDVEGDGHEDAGCSDERQHPSTPKGVAEPGRDQQMTDEEKQESEAEQDEVPRDVASHGDRDERLHGKETEKRDPGDRDAPPDSPDSRTHEAAKAPDRYDESRDPENAERDPHRAQRVPEGELSGLTCEDQCAG